MAVKRERFYIDPEGDSDLYTWLRNIPAKQRSKAIRETLRLGLGRTNADTIGEIVRDVIREELNAATFQVTQTVEGEAEPVFEDPETTSLITALVEYDL